MNHISLSATILFSLLLSHASYSQFYSQCGQDAFVYQKFFSKKTDGVFVDIGAHNGITYSNTYFFEKHRGWKGLCIEPIPEVFRQLRHNRTCICVEGCIYDKANTANFLRVYSAFGEYTDMLSGLVENYDPKHRQRIELETSNGAGFYEEIMVKCYALNDLLETNKLYHVDYMSIDTEGGELDILKSIDFERFTIDVIDVKNNYNDPEFKHFLNSKGYKKIIGGPSPWDEIYVRNDFGLQN